MLVRNLTVIVCAGCLLSFGSPRRAASGSGGTEGTEKRIAPLPIPGGDLIPCPCTGQASGSLLIHKFAAGPAFDGPDVEPNTNFNGIFAQVYMDGSTARAFHGTSTLTFGSTKEST